MTVEAVIFDWGGTLTPWHAIDHEELWLSVCGRHYPAGETAALAEAVRLAESELWRLGETTQHFSKRLLPVADNASNADDFVPSHAQAYLVQSTPCT